MGISEITRRAWVLSILMVVGAALFAIGSSVERDSNDVHDSEPATHVEGSGTGENRAGELAGEGQEQSATASGTGESERVLGLNLESTPLIVVAVAVSVALAALTWRLNTSVLLLATIAFAVAFGLLDLAELSHQIKESRTGLVVIASVLAVIHFAAAAIAEQRRRRIQMQI
jgi:hypothetical protein